MMAEDMNHFTQPLLHWFDQHGRKDLPWQHPRSPYRVWISEIMLQQTQVKTVLPYFERFMQRFPTLQALSEASVDDVLSYWSGLGYYSRGRNLHKTAQVIMKTYEGHFPQTLEELIKLPGVGPSTAAAISSLAFDAPNPILDGNVKRVLARYFMLTDTKRFLEYAQRCMPQTRCADYTQAIMDLGALCCRPRQPNCPSCPLQQHCQAYQNRCVDTYPVRVTKQPLPVKEAAFFLLYHDDERGEPILYLEKRPDTGIWGGLWCLPTCPGSVSPENFLQDRFGLLAPTDKRHENDGELIPFHRLKHTFTHFHLWLNAHSLMLREKLPDEHAFHAKEVLKLGIPKPIRTLIMRFLNALPAHHTTREDKLASIPTQVNSDPMPLGSQEEAANIHLSASNPV